MSDAKTSENEVTAKLDPVSAAIADVAIEFAALASRASETSRLVRTVPAHQRDDLIRAICHALRIACDGGHDYARAIEQFTRG